MIWYFLYPLRGSVHHGQKTTDAPALPPSHPLRKAFARYGRYAARHVVTTLLVSAAVATILIYPIPFLFTTDFINGASNLPHHVWTAAQPLPYHTSAEPDIIMRSLWVHGSYMQALDTELLLSALDLQDELLGVTELFDPGSDADSTPRLSTDSDSASPSAHGDLSLRQRDAAHAINGLTEQSWFFHSPLQYWGCSRQSVLADDDIVTTVNDKKNMTTPVNVTLRHSVVFSGKRFQYRRLQAADALVITLLHRLDSPVGYQWERKAALLAGEVAQEWDVYRPDNRISTSRLYEFQFRPISTQDTMTLALAYGLAICYFVTSLFKVRAVKSKVGLMVTVVTQIIFAIMSSFTVCAIFNIDLSRIPRAAYPLVILAMSLENIFRLINAVIVTPSEDSTSSRIGYAFGETAPVALASTMQNVLILTILSRLVSPSVSAFCIFLAVAIVFDVFYLSTFFLSVLSVDVARTELSDALAKVSMRHHRHVTESRGRTWFEQVIHGRTALSTRIAGTFVMVGFIVIAQWHFYQEQTMLNTTVALFWDSAAHLLSPYKTSALDEINQARSPTSWLRLQDHETAQELINIIKPSAHSYIAQVYEPMVVVRKGSDRSPRSREPTLLPAYYDFINHQLTQFVVIVVVVVAALRLLISYLLYEDQANMDDESDYDEGPLLSVKHFPQGHTLDIAMLAYSAEGHVISVGLDRLVRVWDLRTGRPSYILPGAPGGAGNMFPVYAMATDDESKWLAILSPFRVAFWNLAQRAWGPVVPVENFGQRPEAFFFAPKSPQKVAQLVMVRRNGTVTEVLAEGASVAEDFVICESPLLSAEPLTVKGQGQQPARQFVITASRKGCVHVASRTEAGWTSRVIPVSIFRGQKIHQVLVMRSLGLFLVATTSRVHVFSADNSEVLYAVDTEPMMPRTLQCAYSTQRISHVESPGVTSATISYIEANSGDCVLHSFTPPEDFDSICLTSPSGGTDGEGCEWSASVMAKRRISNPGHVSVLSDGSLLGIRREKLHNGECPNAGGESKRSLRNRFGNRCNGHTLTPKWEVWTRSPSGRTGTDEEQPLFQGMEQPSHLLISDLGPRVKVGSMSVAFAFGNVIKLVTVGGPERFDVASDEAGRQEEFMNVGNRRRKMGNSFKGRAWS